VLVCLQAGCNTACRMLCVHDLAWAVHGGRRLSKVCGGCDISRHQWVWKCFPTPACTRKLETYGYQELCLNRGESACMTSYSNLRMALPTLCVRELFTASGALTGPVEAGKIFSVVFVARSCAC
jgi:hypothetical protein